MLNLPYIKDYGNNMFFMIAGPCVIEGRDITFNIALKLKELTEKYQIPFIFKASYRKANRSKLSSFTGIGDREGLEILQEIRETLKVPVITDIHSAPEAELAASYNIDILQIPAFLCRQTDLLEAAAATGRYVNIKKGQFLAPASMKFAAEKVVASGNNKVMLTERGTMFGYGDLVIDYRRSTGAYPDNGKGRCSSGRRRALPGDPPKPCRGKIGWRKYAQAGPYGAASASAYPDKKGYTKYLDI